MNKKTIINIGLGLLIITGTAMLYNFSNTPEQTFIPTETSVPILYPTGLFNPNEVGRDEPHNHPTPTLTPTPTPEPIQEYTFVLLGLDREGLADAWMVVQIELSNPIRIVMVSLARELYVPIDGLDYGRLNEIIDFNEVELFMREVFDLEIDGVVAIDMGEFEQFVDSIGGINLTPTAYSYDRCGSDEYEFFAGTEYHMSGHELLCYARMRVYSENGYFDRQERHFEIIHALFNAMVDPLLTGHHAQLIPNYLEIVDTDVAIEEWLETFGVVLYRYLFNDQIYSLVSRSMSPPMIELDERANDSVPYTYHPTVDLVEWMQEILND